MHAGQILEQGPVEEVLAEPRHPYTRMLLDSMPYGKEDVSALKAMGGNLPDLRRTDLPRCRFSARCPRAEEACAAEPLPTMTASPGHEVRCRHPLAEGADGQDIATVEASVAVACGAP